MSGRLLAIVAAAACCGGEQPSAKPPTDRIDTEPPHRGPRSAKKHLRYKLAATYDPERKAIAGTVRIDWQNPGSMAVWKMPLHLYMNAFKGADTLFFRESRGEMRGAEAERETGWGSISITEIAVDGSPLELAALEYPGPDETVVTVPLGRAVAPKASVALDIAFDVALPEVFARTGYKGEFAMVGQWYPKPGVRVSGLLERWHCEPFHANSEFFADFADFEVELTVPEDHVVAAPGALLRAEPLGDGTRRLEYFASNVHDFAWMIDPHMRTMSAPAETELGDVDVRVYFREPQRAFARRHLAAGVATVESLSRRLIPYPYTRLSIITPPPDAALGAGGMEYPGLVTTAGDFAFAAPGVYFPEFVTVHEVGHQWFQGLLASNEVDEAWLDEGVNEYINCVLMDEFYGAGKSQIDALGLVADCFALRRAQIGRMSRVLVDPIATRSYEFATRDIYGSTTYRKTALALRTIENLVGREAFARALKAYARRYAYGHPTGADFFATLEAELGRDLGAFVRPAFYGRGVVDLAVIDVDCDKRERYDCRVVVANRGEVPVPYTAEIELADGEVRRRQLAAGPSHHTIELEVDSPVVAVTLDPDDRILLNQGGLASDWRDAVSLGPSAQVAARTQHWAQALFGLVGL